MQRGTPAVFVSLAMLAGCYLSHPREREAPAALDAAIARDAAPLDAAPFDAGALGIDASPSDAGPPRALRWVRLAETSTERPPARYSHFAVYDAARDRMLILGGFDPYGELGHCCLPEWIHHRDVWSLDLESERWSRVAELDQPLTAANAVSATLDAPRRRIVLIGAAHASDGGPRNVAIDLDSFAISSFPAGPWPAPSAPLRAAHDPSGQRIVVHGAYWADLTEGVWSLDLTTDTWSTLGASSPPPIRFHAPLVSGVRPGSMLLFGGYDGDRGHADLWELDLASRRWAAVPLSSDIGERYRHRMITEPVRGVLVAFGSGHWSTHDSTVTIDLSARTVEEPILDPRPPGRRDSTMVLDSRRRRALVFGGAFESSRAYADAWALELP